MFVEKITKEDTILLLSIKPIFSRLILEEKKTIELRKRMPKEEIKYAIIYETSPTKKITGFFEIKRMYRESVERLLELSKKAHVSRKFIKRYYDGYENGTAIEIEEVFELDNHISIDKLKRHNIAIPQDYRYLEKNIVNELIKS